MVNIPGGIWDWVLVAAVLILTWLALRSKKIFLRRMDKKRLEGKRTLDAFTQQMVGKVFTIVIFFISLMLILQIFGLNIVPLLTFSGIGAAVLGFASKDVVANFFGGLMIYITRPFAVNDFIEIPSKKIAGTVEDIGWYLTSIRDAQKKSIYVPNSTFPTELLLNYSRMTHRRIEEQIRVRITDSDEAARFIEKAKAIVEKHPEIDHKEQTDLFLLSISLYGTVIDVKAYTKTTKYPKYMEVKQDILLKIHKLAISSEYGMAEK